MESKDLTFSGNFTGSHNGANYDVSYQCSHDIDSTYEDDIRDYVEEMISDTESGYESFEMSTGFYDGEIEIEGTITWGAESFNAETFEAMGWHDPRWAGDREAVEAKFKAMYPTYTIEEDSIDYLVYSGGASNKYHVFFLATDPAGNYHSFNAYGRIGYTPTLFHNAGPGTRGSVTQAISKKRYQKSKKGYVQQAETFEAPKICLECNKEWEYDSRDKSHSNFCHDCSPRPETFEADFDYYYSSYDKGRGMEILDRLRTMNPETKAKALDWLIDNGYLHSEEVYNSAYINAMGDALYITGFEEEEYDADFTNTAGRYKWTHGFFEDLSKEKQIEVLEEVIEHDSKNPRYSWNSGEIYDPSSQYDDKTVPSVAFLLDGKNVNPKVMLEHLKKSAVMNAEGILTKSEWDSYADVIEELKENGLNELENQLSVSSHPEYKSWRSWIGHRMPSEITSSQDRKIYQKMESINTEIEGLIKIMYPDGIRAKYTEDYDAEESFAYQVFDKVLSEKDYEKVELAKPIRTGWGLGAGIALFSVTATLAAVTLSNFLGENKGDE